MIHIPAGFYSAYKDPRINWNYLTEPETGLRGRQVEMPRGQGGGRLFVDLRHGLHAGTSTGLTTGGQTNPALGNGVTQDCLPYFRAGETSDRGASDWRALGNGGDGPLGVTKGTSDNPLYHAFLEAGATAGQGTTDDPNGYDPEGVSRLDRTTRNGRRCSAAVAHLHPSLSRANLSLITRATVERIAVSGNRACGVAFSHRGESRTVEAEREVIVSGGALNSPQILMLSGIGPADHLRDHGIEVRRDLPGVGRNLQDHASVAITWACTRSFPVHTLDRPFNRLLAGAGWFLTREGLAASNHFEAGGLIRGNPDVAYPNLQYHFGPVGYEHEGTKLRLKQAFMLQVDQLRPRSRGYMALKSADPGTSPAMFFRYLSDPRDLRELVEAVRKMRDLVAQPAFGELRGVELVPGGDVQTDAEISDAVRALATTDFHACGTCRMGHGADAVVDSRTQGPRHGSPARRRRLGHAARGQRQSQRADPDDRLARRRLDSRHATARAFRGPIRISRCGS